MTELFEFTVVEKNVAKASRVIGEWRSDKFIPKKRKFIPRSWSRNVFGFIENPTRNELAFHEIFNMGKSLSNGEELVRAEYLSGVMGLFGYVDSRYFFLNRERKRFSLFFLDGEYYELD